MLNIGMTEILVFSIIALLVLGPEKLPEAIRFIAKWYHHIKRTIHNVQYDLDRELRLSELREQLQDEMKKIQELEIKMQKQLNNQAISEPISSLEMTKKRMDFNLYPQCPIQYQFITNAHHEIPRCPYTQITPTF